MGDFSHVTFMLCLPRSRSAWMCEFLRPVATTYHDPLKRCSSITDLKQLIPYTDPVFIADTAAVFFTQQIIREFPGAKFLFVFRTRHDVIVSLSNAARAFNLMALEEAEASLHKSLRAVKAEGRKMMGVRFCDINQNLQKIWGFVSCPDSPLFPVDHTARTVGRNIQVPFAEQNRQTDYNKMHALFASRDQHRLVPGLCPIPPA